MPLGFLHRGLVHEWADLNARLQAVADLQGPHLLRISGQKILIDRPLNVNPVGGQAILARGREFGGNGAGDGFIKIRIVENHEGSVAAKLHDQPLDGRRGLRRDQTADFRRSGKGDAVSAPCFCYAWQQ